MPKDYRQTKAYELGFDAGYKFASRYAVKHARWEKCGVGYRCSKCGTLISRLEYHRGNHHYCYVCGSKMEGVS